MISRLVRTELESHLHDLIVWGGTVFLLLVLFLSFMGTVVTRSGGVVPDDLTGLFLLSVGLASLVLAVKVFRRNVREKRVRLFSQLPVSAREVSFASWCVRLSCLSIPVLACTVYIARAANMPFADFAVVTLAIYLCATTLVAAISVGITIPHLPLPMSAWAKGVYIACAMVAVMVWIGGNLFVFPPLGRLTNGGAPVLIGGLLVASVGLVVIDVWLRDRADDYLG